METYDSSDEETEDLVSLVNAIPEDLRLSISPGALTSTPSMSFRRNRLRKQIVLLNGPNCMVPEQRRMRHIEGIHFRNLALRNNELVQCYFTIQPYYGSSSSSLRQDDILYKSSICSGSLVCKKKKKIFS